MPSSSSSSKARSAVKKKDTSLTRSKRRSSRSSSTGIQPDDELSVYQELEAALSADLESRSAQKAAARSARSDDSQSDRSADSQALGGDSSSCDGAGEQTAGAAAAAAGAGAEAARGGSRAAGRAGKAAGRSATRTRNSRKKNTDTAAAADSASDMPADHMREDDSVVAVAADIFVDDDSTAQTSLISDELMSDAREHARRRRAAFDGQDLTDRADAAADVADGDDGAARDGSGRDDSSGGGDSAALSVHDDSDELVQIDDGGISGAATDAADYEYTASVSDDDAASVDDEQAESSEGVSGRAGRGSGRAARSARGSRSRAGSGGSRASSRTGSARGEAGAGYGGREDDGYVADGALADDSKFADDSNGRGEAAIDVGTDLTGDEAAGSDMHIGSLLNSGIGLSHAMIQGTRLASRRSGKGEDAAAISGQFPGSDPRRVMIDRLTHVSGRTMDMSALIHELKLVEKEMARVAGQESLGGFAAAANDLILYRKLEELGAEQYSNITAGQLRTLIKRSIPKLTDKMILECWQCFKSCIKNEELSESIEEIAREHNITLPYNEVEAWLFTEEADFRGDPVLSAVRRTVVDAYSSYEEELLNIVKIFDIKNSHFSKAYDEVTFYYYLIAHKTGRESDFRIYEALVKLKNHIELFILMRGSFVKTSDFSVFSDSEQAGEIYDDHSVFSQPVYNNGSELGKLDPCGMHFCYLESVLTKVVDSQSDRDLLFTFIRKFGDLYVQQASHKFFNPSMGFEFDFVPGVLSYLHGVYACKTGAEAFYDASRRVEDSEESPIVLYELFINEEALNSARCAEHRHAWDKFHKTLAENPFEHQFTDEMKEWATHIYHQEAVDRAVASLNPGIVTCGHPMSAEVNYLNDQVYCELMAFYSKYLINIERRNLYALTQQQAVDEAVESASADDDEAIGAAATSASAAAAAADAADAADGADAHDGAGADRDDGDDDSEAAAALAAARAAAAKAAARAASASAAASASGSDDYDSDIWLLGDNGFIPVIPGTPALSSFLIGRVFTYGELIGEQNIGMGYSAMIYADICGNYLASAYRSQYYQALFDSKINCEGQLFFLYQMRSILAFHMGMTCLDMPLCSLRLYHNYDFHISHSSTAAYFRALSAQSDSWKKILERNPTLDPGLEHEGRQCLQSTVFGTIVSNALIYLCDLVEENTRMGDFYHNSLLLLTSLLARCLKAEYNPAGCLAVYRVMTTNWGGSISSIDQAEFSVLFPHSSPSDLLYHQLFPHAASNSNADDLIGPEFSREDTAALFLQTGMLSPDHREQGYNLLNGHLSSYKGNFAPVTEPYLDELYRTSAGLGNASSISYLSEISHALQHEDESDLYALMGGRMQAGALYKKLSHYFIKNEMDAERSRLAFQMFLMHRPYGFYESYLVLREHEDRIAEAHTWLFYAARLAVPEAVSELESLKASGRFEPLPFVVYIKYLEELALTRVDALLALRQLATRGGVLPVNSLYFMRYIERNHEFFSNSMLRRNMLSSGQIDLELDEERDVLKAISHAEFFKSELDYLRFNSTDMEGNFATFHQLEEQDFDPDAFTGSQIGNDQIAQLVTRIFVCLSHGTSQLERALLLNWYMSGSLPSYLTPLASKLDITVNSRQDHVGIDSVMANYRADLDTYPLSLNICLCMEKRGSHILDKADSVDEVFEAIVRGEGAGITLETMYAFTLNALRGRGRPNVQLFLNMCRYLANVGDSAAARFTHLCMDHLTVMPYGDVFNDTMVESYERDVTRWADFFARRAFDGDLLRTMIESLEARLERDFILKNHLTAGEGTPVEPGADDMPGTAQSGLSGMLYGGSAITAQTIDVLSGDEGSDSYEQRVRQLGRQEDRLNSLIIQENQEAAVSFVDAYVKELERHRDDRVARAAEAHSSMEDVSEVMDDLNEVDIFGPTSTLILQSNSFDRSRLLLEIEPRLLENQELVIKEHIAGRIYLKAFIDYLYFMKTRGWNTVQSMVFSRNGWQLGRRANGPARSYASLLARDMLTGAPGARERFLYYVQSHAFRYHLNSEYFHEDDSSQTARRFATDVLQIDLRSQRFEEFSSSMDLEGFPEFKALILEESNGYVAGRPRFCIDGLEYDPESGYSSSDSDPVPDLVLSQEEAVKARDELKNLARTLNDLSTADAELRSRWFTVSDTALAAMVPQVPDPDDADGDEDDEGDNGSARSASSDRAGRRKAGRRGGTRARALERARARAQARDIARAGTGAGASASTGADAKGSIGAQSRGSTGAEDNAWSNDSIWDDESSDSKRWYDDWSDWIYDDSESESAASRGGLPAIVDREAVIARCQIERIIGMDNIERLLGSDGQWISYTFYENSSTCSEDILSMLGPGCALLPYRLLKSIDPESRNRVLSRSRRLNSLDISKEQGSDISAFQAGDINTARIYGINPEHAVRRWHVSREQLIDASAQDAARHKAALDRAALDDDDERKKAPLTAHFRSSYDYALHQVDVMGVALAQLYSREQTSMSATVSSGTGGSEDSSSGSRSRSTRAALRAGSSAGAAGRAAADRAASHSAAESSAHRIYQDDDYEDQLADELMRHIEEDSDQDSGARTTESATSKSGSRSGRSSRAGRTARGGTADKAGKAGRSQAASAEVELTPEDLGLTQSDLIDDSHVRISTSFKDLWGRGKNGSDGNDADDQIDGPDALSALSIYEYEPGDLQELTAVAADEAGADSDKENTLLSAGSAAMARRHLTVEEKLLLRDLISGKEYQGGLFTLSYASDPDEVIEKARRRSKNTGRSYGINPGESWWDDPAEEQQRNGAAAVSAVIEEGAGEQGSDGTGGMFSGTGSAVRALRARMGNDGADVITNERSDDENLIYDRLKSFLSSRLGMAIPGLEGVDAAVLSEGLGPGFDDMDEASDDGSDSCWSRVRAAGSPLLRRIFEHAWEFDEQLEYQYTRPWMFHEDENPLHVYIYMLLNLCTANETWDLRLGCEEQFLDALYSQGYYFGCSDLVDCSFKNTVYESWRYRFERSEVASQRGSAISNLAGSILERILNKDELTEFYRCDVNAVTEETAIVAEHFTFPEDTPKHYLVEALINYSDEQVSRRSRYYKVLTSATARQLQSHNYMVMLDDSLQHQAFYDLFNSRTMLARAPNVMHWLYQHSFKGMDIGHVTPRHPLWTRGSTVLDLISATLERSTMGVTADGDGTPSTRAPAASTSAACNQAASSSAGITPAASTAADRGLPAAAALKNHLHSGTAHDSLALCPVETDTAAGLLVDSPELAYEDVRLAKFHSSLSGDEDCRRLSYVELIYGQGCSYEELTRGQRNELDALTLKFIGMQDTLNAAAESGGLVYSPFAAEYVAAGLDITDDRPWSDVAEQRAREFDRRSMELYGYHGLRGTTLGSYRDQVNFSDEDYDYFQQYFAACPLKKASGLKDVADRLVFSGRTRDALAMHNMSLVQLQTADPDSEEESEEIELRLACYEYARSMGLKYFIYDEDNFSDTLTNVIISHVCGHREALIEQAAAAAAAAGIDLSAGPAAAAAAAAAASASGAAAADRDEHLDDGPGESGYEDQGDDDEEISDEDVLTTGDGNYIFSSDELRHWAQGMEDESDYASDVDGYDEDEDSTADSYQDDTGYADEEETIYGDEDASDYDEDYEDEAGDYADAGDAAQSTDVEADAYHQDDEYLDDGQYGSEHDQLQSYELPSEGESGYDELSDEEISDDDILNPEVQPGYDELSDEEISDEDILNPEVLTEDELSDEEISDEDVLNPEVLTEEELSDEEISDEDMLNPEVQPDEELSDEEISDEDVLNPEVQPEYWEGYDQESYEDEYDEYDSDEDEYRKEEQGEGHYHDPASAEIAAESGSGIAPASQSGSLSESKAAGAAYGYGYADEDGADAENCESDGQYRDNSQYGDDESEYWEESDEFSDDDRQAFEAFAQSEQDLPDNLASALESYSAAAAAAVCAPAPAGAGMPDGAAGSGEYVSYADMDSSVSEDQVTAGLSLLEGEDSDEDLKRRFNEYMYYYSGNDDLDYSGYDNYGDMWQDLSFEKNSQLKSETLERDRERSRAVSESAGEDDNYVPVSALLFHQDLSIVDGDETVDQLSPASALAMSIAEDQVRMREGLMKLARKEELREQLEDLDEYDYDYDFDDDSDDDEEPMFMSYDQMESFSRFLAEKNINPMDIERIADALVENHFDILDQKGLSTDDIKRAMRDNGFEFDENSALEEIRATQETASGTAAAGYVPSPDDDTDTLQLQLSHKDQQYVCRSGDANTGRAPESVLTSEYDSVASQPDDSGAGLTGLSGSDLADTDQTGAELTDTAQADTELTEAQDAELALTSGSELTAEPGADSDTASAAAGSSASGSPASGSATGRVPGSAPGAEQVSAGSRKGAAACGSEKKSAGSKRGRSGRSKVKK